MATIEGPETSSFAIVGYAARFPGATDAESFWEMLREGPPLERQALGSLHERMHLAQSGHQHGAACFKTGDSKAHGKGSFTFP